MHIILLDVTLSLKVKRNMIASNKLGIYEVTHELPNNLRLRILGNYERSEKN